MINRKLWLNLAMPVTLAVFACCPGKSSAQAPPEANKLMTLQQVEIHGSRLPDASLVKLAGLTAGSQVNDMVVNKGCRKITSTGLVKSVDYTYNVYPDQPGVTLVLTLVDEGPLFPAKITPQSEEQQLWQTLQSEDPLFVRELPRTEKALSFYSTHLESILKSLGRSNEYVAPSVTGDANGSASSIVFAIRTYKQMPTHR